MKCTLSVLPMAAKLLQAQLVVGCTPPWDPGCCRDKTKSCGQTLGRYLDHRNQMSGKDSFGSVVAPEFMCGNKKVQPSDLWWQPEACRSMMD